MLNRAFCYLDNLIARLYSSLNKAIIDISIMIKINNMVECVWLYLNISYNTNIPIMNPAIGYAISLFFSNAQTNPTEISPLIRRYIAPKNFVLIER